jgi:hypothetical protein
MAEWKIDKAELYFKVHSIKPRAVINVNQQRGSVVHSGETTKTTT